MTTISIRISEEEKNELRKHGELSNVVRDAITLYLTSKRSREAIMKLKELQKIEKPMTTRQEEITLLRKERRR